MEIAVVVPTLNERGNIVDLIEGVLKADARLHIVVVDDGSSDGTAELVAAAAHEYSARGRECVHLIQRGRKLGFASALQDGMRYALKHDAQFVLHMDADFSHDPKYLPEILAQSRSCDLVIGSRYIRGGGTRNWGMGRKILSAGGNSMVRLLLRLPVRDCTSGFRCWRRELIEKAGVLNLSVEGYAFQFLALERCFRAGALIVEVPILFVDRRHGKSKMSRRIILEATRALSGLWWQRLTRPSARR
jgi:dolichol-phosphate mannosyltransferase